MCICMKMRARSALKLCVTATTGGQAPRRVIRRSIACHLVGALGVDIDHDHGSAVDIQRVADFGEPPG